ncbi:hypothetical protein QBC35DRAFT_516887 [Podospora australis]|uniref:Uncharacterized protein n=1 Tax=Podospora australis TaxID=1536484 RepID=A0AAN7AGX0_9PEZI|nr:hypothetical protein QBC35DRAFT_516887 [Podospora australis]
MATRPGRRHSKSPSSSSGNATNNMGVVDAATACAVGSQPEDLRCCCGREDCVFLRHNCSVLLTVERDVHAAAKMGQTLLARHEAYMASAERDRAELTARIEQLEAENSELEHKNKAVNDENFNLREELDHLNETVRESDTKIEYLEATLRDSQLELRRLELAADRAASLERQIALLEEEQVTLETTVSKTKEEARTAMHRWRQAEKGLIDLQEQLERMEKETREDRERHVEIISRMERQRAMEKELNTAAGRLKGAAAVKSMTDSKSGNVVSHFVRDLLQDNANLQLGIAELREMLVNSNDEIQSLREQLLYHQPAALEAPPDEATLNNPPTTGNGHTPLTSQQTLRAELERQKPLSPPPKAKVSQEFHIHHHYHVTHKPELKKMRKKRQGITMGTFTPPRMFSAPSSPVATTTFWQPGTLTGAILSQPTRSDTPISPDQWPHIDEEPPEFEPSSLPSSPRSLNRSSVLFDRVVDVSFPGSPTTSVDPTSPAWRNAHKKRTSEFSTRSISGAMFPRDPRDSTTAHPLTNFVLSGDRSPRRPPQRTNAAHNDADDSYDGPSTDAGDLISPITSHYDLRMLQRPRGLRRVGSQESIMSLSNGLDIHTLKSRPGQLSIGHLGLTAAGTNVSDVIAQPTLSRTHSDGKLLRDNLANIGNLMVPRSQQPAGRTVSAPVRSRDATRNTSAVRTPSAIGRLVSWRPWGGAGAASSTNPSPEHTPVATPTIPASTAIPALSFASPAASSSSKSPQGSVSSLTGKFRPPGINQSGSIPGFHEYFAAHQRRGPSSKRIRRPSG